ncbi:MAG: P-loop NTPase [Dehalococcoidia bacterium]
MVTGQSERTADGAGNALRVLLVTSDPDVLEALRRSFRGRGFAVAGEAWPGIDAVRRAAALRPDVVLMHVEEPIVPALRTAQALADASDAGLAIISSADDLETVRRVMNAGAHDFATLPLSDDELRDAASRAAAAAGRRSAAASPSAAQASSSGRIITIASPRGGTGKSTIAANLAIELGRGSRTGVVAVDLDLLFGSVAMMLDTLPEVGIQEWKRDRAKNPAGAVSPYVIDTASGVRLLAAPTDPDPEVEITPQDVSDLLTDLSSTYEYVVVDTGPGFNDVTRAALERATMPLMVTTPEAASLRAVRHVVQQLRTSPGLVERMALVLNYSRAYAPVDELPADPGAPVNWEIRHDVQVLRAALAGVPVSTHKAGATLPRVLREVVAALDEAPPAEQPARRRMLGVI